MADVHIRMAGPSDVGLLSGIIRQSFRDVALRFGLTLGNCPKHPSNCTDDWVQKDFDRGVTYYVMESNAAAVGCAAIEKVNWELCYLERLSVIPDARRRGFGRLLCDHVIAAGKQYGANQLRIGIIAHDLDLKDWYRRIGFVEGKTKKFDHLPFRVTFMTYDL